MNGTEFARVTFTVAAISDEEFVTGLSGEFTLDDFPEPGETTLIHWEQGLQAFIIGPAGTGTGGTSGSGTQRLENPGLGTAHSGVGVISGWVCDAVSIEIVIDDTITLQAAYGAGRADTEDICGDQDNGFSLLLNWNLLTDGEHTIHVLADGVEFASTTFTVTTLGVEFAVGLSGEFVIANFPEPGVNTTIVWVQSLQNFAITGTDAATGP